MFDFLVGLAIGVLIGASIFALITRSSTPV